jgi:hypothetical protein
METPQIPNVLSHYLTALRAHEKLIIIVVGAFLLFHFYGAGLKAWVDHDQRLATAAAQQVKTDHDSNNQTQAQLSQLLAVVAQQQASLDKIMSQRAAQTVEQKKTDAQMTPSELATRFQHLLSVGPQDVTWLPVTGNLVFTPPAAQADIDALEDLQQLKADKADLQTELKGQESLVAKQTDLLNGKTKELADEKDSHQKDVNELKKKVRSAWLSGFKWGAIAGIVGVEAVRVMVFHKP